MVKLVDTRDLKSLAERCAGSSPATRTNYFGKIKTALVAVSLCLSYNRYKMPVDAGCATGKKEKRWKVKF